MPPQSVEIHPLTPDRWPDVEKLFGEKGACAGCWCMWWRQSGPEFSRNRGAANRKKFQAIVRSGRAPGLIAYKGNEAIGWCAVEPRSAYPRLERSRTLKPLDDIPVWSVTCFFVAKGHRRQGVTTLLLDAAARHAAENGATVLEGYPVEPASGRSPDPWVFTGLPGAFEKAGFEEVARPSRTRPIMRRDLAMGGRRSKRKR